MRIWDVTIEFRLTDDPDVVERLADDLVEVLADAEGVVTIRDDHLLVDVTVRARDHAGATRRAWSVVRAAFGSIDLVVHPDAVDRIEAIDEQLARARLAEPTYPPMLGLSEVAEMLAVSRQRVLQLRAEGRLPEPIASLRAGPVWPKPTIERWLEGWERKPGRPPRAARSMS